MASWTNADGLLIRYGADRATVATDGVSRQETQSLEIVIAHGDIPGTADVNEDRPQLPANAVITDAFLVCNTAWTGTSPTLTIGLANSAGTAIDANGIDNLIAVDTVQAAAGDVVACDGALVDKTASIGSARGWVYAAEGGTVTAGKSTLYLRYFVPVV